MRRGFLSFPRFPFLLISAALAWYWRLSLFTAPPVGGAIYTAGISKKDHIARHLPRRKDHIVIAVCGCGHIEPARR